MFKLTKGQLAQLEEFSFKYDSGNYELELVPKDETLKPLTHQIAWEGIHFGTEVSITLLVEDIFNLLNDPDRD